MKKSLRILCYFAIFSVYRPTLAAWYCLECKRRHATRECPEKLRKLAQDFKCYRTCFSESIKPRRGNKLQVFSPCKSWEEIKDLERIEPTFSLRFESNQPVLLLNGQPLQGASYVKEHLKDGNSYIPMFEFKYGSKTIFYAPTLIKIPNDLKDCPSFVGIYNKSFLIINGKPIRGFSYIHHKEISNWLTATPQEPGIFKKSGWPIEDDQASSISLLFTANNPDIPTLLLDGKPIENLAFLQKSIINTDEYLFGCSDENYITHYIKLRPPKIKIDENIPAPITLKFNPENKYNFTLLINGETIKGFFQHGISSSKDECWFFFLGTNAGNPDCTFEFGGAIIVNNNPSTESNKEEIQDVLDI